MCVIVYKTGKTQIAYRTIQDMWDSNPHGAGVALFLDAETVHIEKGFTKPHELFQYLKTVEGTPLAIHFRIATHGEHSAELTHPFVVTTDLNEATQVATDTQKPVIFHNGIISGFGDSGIKSKVSDTLDYVTSVLAYLPDATTIKRVLMHTGSKYILMMDHKFYIVGDFHKHKGLLCSNIGFSYKYTPQIQGRLGVVGQAPYANGRARYRWEDAYDDDDSIWAYSQDGTKNWKERYDEEKRIEKLLESRTPTIEDGEVVDPKLPLGSLDSAASHSSSAEVLPVVLDASHGSSDSADSELPVDSATSPDTVAELLCSPTPPEE